LDLTATVPYTFARCALVSDRAGRRHSAADGSPPGRSGRSGDGGAAGGGGLGGRGRGRFGLLPRELARWWVVGFVSGGMVARRGRVRHVHRVLLLDGRGFCPRPPGGAVPRPPGRLPHGRRRGRGSGRLWRRRWGFASWRRGRRRRAFRLLLVGHEFSFERTLHLSLAVEGCQFGVWGQGNPKRARGRAAQNSSPGSGGFPRPARLISRLARSMSPRLARSRK